MICELLGTHLHGVSGPFLLGLQGKFDIAMATESGSNQFRLIPDDDDQSFDSGRASCVQNMFDQRTSTRRVHDLRQIGLHPSSFAGSENNRNRVGHDEESVIRIECQCDQ